MGVIQIGILGVCGAVLSIILKQTKPEYSLLVSVVICILIFLGMIDALEGFIGTIERIKSSLALNSQYLSVILKVTGISYIAEFSSSICKDAGYHSIAGQIEVFSKLAILALSIPILLALIECIGEFLS
ncbi:MAG: SpoIIIAC/SpoIIIAD family protein [Hespellia sp.]|nr:SpoIIIAC/SpoIIIAD family protein [Hespellia sp.]